MSSSNNHRVLTRSGTKVLKRTVNLDVIDALGITALVGYEAESNQCVGLCTATYSDYHYHLALASTDTYVYRTRSKHRLIHACMQGNVKWFTLLWKAGSVEDMIRLHHKNENLVCHLLRNAQEDRGDPNPDTLNRLSILRTLVASPIDMVKVGRYEIENNILCLGPLNLVIFRRNYGIAMELLKYPNRIDPNKPDQYPPIVAAAVNNFWEIGIELAALPTVNLNATDYKQRTTLHAAVYWSNVAYIPRVLLPNQARMNVNLANNEGQTALSFACMKELLEMVQTLLSFPNININTRDINQRTPLHYAIIKASVGIVRVLVQDPSKCDVNVQDNHGDTPLHFAIGLHLEEKEEETKQRYFEIIRILAAVPTTNFNIKNIVNETVYDMVMRKGHDSDPTIVAELVKYKDRFDLSVLQKYNL